MYLIDAERFLYRQDVKIEMTNLTYSGVPFVALNAEMETQSRLLLRYSICQPKSTRKPILPK